jgi:hypothetical protein
MRPTSVLIILAGFEHPTWAELYEASVISDPKAGNWLKVRAKRARGLWKTYISNTSAESKLRFNKKAGVAELPSYFSRHTIANIGEYDGSAGMLIELSNPVSGVDVAIVDDAGLDSSTVQSDYELLAGRSGLFNFQKITVDGSDRITQIIEYPAGSVAVSQSLSGLRMLIVLDTMKMIANLGVMRRSTRPQLI